VRLHAVSVCEIQQGRRLAFSSFEAITVHYVLKGGGALRVGNGPQLPFAAQSTGYAGSTPLSRAFRGAYGTDPITYRSLGYHDEPEPRRLAGPAAPQPGPRLPFASGNVETPPNGAQASKLADFAPEIDARLPAWPEPPICKRLLRAMTVRPQLDLSGTHTASEPP